ncbi:hypothetical protein APR08_005931 [Nocardia amikacinitolerans]|nr:hypothetical protein [Nocardia amikacinitolerans]
MPRCVADRRRAALPIDAEVRCRGALRSTRPELPIDTARVGRWTPNRVADRHGPRWSIDAGLRWPIDAEPRCRSARPALPIDTARVGRSMPGCVGRSTPSRVADRHGPSCRSTRPALADGRRTALADRHGPRWPTDAAPRCRSTRPALVDRCRAALVDRRRAALPIDAEVRCRSTRPVLADGRRTVLADGRRTVLADRHGPRWPIDAEPRQRGALAGAEPRRLSTPIYVRRLTASKRRRPGPFRRTRPSACVRQRADDPVNSPSSAVMKNGKWAANRCRFWSRSKLPNQ